MKEAKRVPIQNVVYGVIWALTLGLFLVVLMTQAFAGEGTSTISAVADNGDGSYTLTVDDTSSMTVGDHFGAKLADGSGSIYSITSLVSSTSMIVTDSLTEGNGDSAYGAPAAGDAWYATPTTASGLSAPPYQAKGWDAPMKRNAEVLDGADAIDETGDPATLTVGAIADGELLIRSGTAVIGSTSPVVVEEVDTSPSVAGVTKIVVTNGSLTDDTGGQVTLDLTTGDTDTLGGLTPTDGNFAVGDGAAWVVETGATARASMGLGTTDVATFDSVALSTPSTLNEATVYESGGAGTDTGFTIKDDQVAMISGGAAGHKVIVDETPTGDAANIRVQGGTAAFPLNPHTTETSGTHTRATPGAVYTNPSATGVITFSIGAGTTEDGVFITVMRTNATYACRIDPGGGEVFRNTDGSATTAGKYKSLDTDGACMILCFDGTNDEWLVLYERGTISDEP